MAITRGQVAPFASSHLTGPVTTIACTFGTNPTAGSSILVWCQPNIAAITSVTDNAGNTYTLVAGGSGSGSTRGAAVYRANSIALPGSGTLVVTMTVNSAKNISIQAIEYAGLGATTTNARANGTGTAAASGTISFAAGDLVFGGVSTNSSANPSTLTLTSTGCTDEGHNLDGAGGVVAGCMDGILTGSGTVGSNWTVSSATWDALIVGFNPSGGASSAIKTVDGLAKASVKTVDGLAIASVKTVDGLAKAA